MQRQRSLTRRLKDAIRPRGKAAEEMRYWRARAAEEGTLRGDHYRRVFTTHFEIPTDFFHGKRVLDVGCGPRGSLEWADMTSERIGLDPLVDGYRELGIDHHEMRYVSAPAESMPFADGYFHIISALNSLDHVDDVSRAITEITRVAMPGAALLLMVEVGHEPTATEPHSLDWEIVDQFASWNVDWLARTAVRDDHDLYASIEDGVAYETGAGILRARLTRTGHKPLYSLTLV